MGFSQLKDLVDAEVTGGAFSIASFRKTPSQTTVSPVPFDLSMAAGNPSAQFYASEPLVAALINAKYGLSVGGDPTDTNHLAELMVLSTSSGFAPGSFLLCDYLLYYPFVDMDNTDTQLMDNTVTLPRYQSGSGVRIFAVAQSPSIGSGAFSVTYVNQDGVTKSTGTIACSSGVTNIASSIIGVPSGSIRPGFFLPLAAGDTGVQSITSVTFSSANGGLAAFVLVKPLTSIELEETISPAEINYYKDRPSLPRIVSGAVLNFIAMSGASAAGAPVIGTIKTVWN